MSKAFAYTLSLIGHPMLMIMYVLFIYIKINPYLFPYSDPHDLRTLGLRIFVFSIWIPMVGILLMRGVGFIKSLEMRDRQERIGPLIITSIAYLWLYLNVRTYSAVPMSFANFVLGALIAMFVAFFLNNFSKISLHAVGLGGLIMGVLHLILSFGDKYIYMNMFGVGLQLHSLVVIAVVIVLAAAVLTSRLYLRAHTNQEISGGFSVGVVGQLIAIIFF